MENEDTFKIVDAKGNEVLTDISMSFFEFINKLDDMRQLYRLSNYSMAEQMRDELSVKLDDLMRCV